VPVSGAETYGALVVVDSGRQMRGEPGKLSELTGLGLLVTAAAVLAIIRTRTMLRRRMMLAKRRKVSSTLKKMKLGEDKNQTHLPETVTTTLEEVEK